jgi:hypothetical protein
MKSRRRQIPLKVSENRNQPADQIHSDQAQDHHPDTNSFDSPYQVPFNDLENLFPKEQHTTKQPKQKEDDQQTVKHSFHVSNFPFLRI